MERAGRRALPLRWRLASLLRPSSCSLSSSSSVHEPLFLSSSRRHHLPLSLRLADHGRPYHATAELDGLACPPASPASPKNHRPSKPKNKKKLLSNAYGFTSSSSSDALFSSDDEEQEDPQSKELLLSSRSFSSDSSGLYYRSRRTAAATRHRRRHTSGFLPLVSMEEEGEEREGGRGGFAVEKVSSDPYADFRSSMLEMIMERQIFAERELQALLRSYLGLNSPRHHPVILQVFREICEALFAR